jgi:hypothetical protein
MVEEGERPDRSDQLSPNQALHESTGATGSQRIGNNGPVANPIVSFPEEPGEGDDAEQTPA